MKNQIVTDTVSAIMTQARIDERFRADITKAVAAVYDAATDEATTVVESAPLTHDEIELFRDSMRGPRSAPVVNVTVPVPSVTVNVPAQVAPVTAVSPEKLN